MSKQQKAYVNQWQQANSPRIWLYINVILAIVLIVAGFVMLLWLGQQQSTPSRAATLNPVFSQQIGQPAPDFTLASLEGETVSLSDYTGQVVLINTWATWCPPCRAEMPAINTFYEAHQDKGFTVLAVNNQEDAQTITDFVEASGFGFPVLLDPEAEMTELYQVRGLPTTFIIGRDGTIQHVQAGTITDRQLESIILPLLAGS
jgi:peroxiredoxin